MYNLKICHESKPGGLLSFLFPIWRGVTFSVEEECCRVDWSLPWPAVLLTFHLMACFLWITEAESN